MKKKAGCFKIFLVIFGISLLPPQNALCFGAKDPINTECFQRAVKKLSNNSKMARIAVETLDYKIEPLKVTAKTCAVLATIFGVIGGIEGLKADNCNSPDIISSLKGAFICAACGAFIGAVLVYPPLKGWQTYQKAKRFDALRKQLGMDSNRRITRKLSENNTISGTKNK